MRTWSIPAGRLFGIELRIHISFAFLLLFIGMTEQLAHITVSPWRGTALLAIVFGSIVLHELGHALIAKQSGVAPKAVVLFPICEVTVFDETQPEIPANWTRDVRIAMAGPGVNFLIAALSGFFLSIAAPQSRLWSDPYVTSTNLPHSLVWTNLWLGLLNLLPAYPLDGGRVLRVIFSRSMDPAAAMRRAISIGRGFALVFLLAGWWLNPGLALVGFFLFVAAQMEDRSAVFRSVLETVRLADIMLTDFATLSPADTLEDALDKAVHCLQDDFPVIRGADMVGVVSKQKILQTLRREGNGYVQAVMNRIFDVAQKSETLSSAFRKLSTRNLSIIPVVEDQQLVGIVTLQNLMHSMALLAETRKLRKATLES
ncbi:MAG TPA: site-2 protease family protein [Terriglobales bacterium]|nr:site-2 protease family protein [Terriglobales bacterium]